MNTNLLSTASSSVLICYHVLYIPLNRWHKSNINGRVAGLSIISVSGSPGTPSEIRIRGAGSFLSNNSPLIVIDGIPHENYAIGENDKFPGLDLLSLINTMDVHSVTVLKDASDVAPYGVKGTNGVIVINTKRAIEGPTLRDILEELNLID